MKKPMTLGEVGAFLAKPGHRPLSIDRVRELITHGKKIRGVERPVKLRSVQMPGWTGVMEEDLQLFIRECSAARGGLPTGGVVAGPAAELVTQTAISRYRPLEMFRRTTDVGPLARGVPGHAARTPAPARRRAGTD
jgi:hypothetical protein